jgi:hypothetical protein
MTVRRCLRCPLLLVWPPPPHAQVSFHLYQCSRVVSLVPAVLIRVKAAAMNPVGGCSAPASPLVRLVRLPPRPVYPPPPPSLPQLDFKIRTGIFGKAVIGREPSATEPIILGFDGAGLVEAVGSAVTLFKVCGPLFPHAARARAREWARANRECVGWRVQVGDRAYAAGVLTRDGTNAELV